MDILAELENFKNQYAAANALFEEATAEVNAIKAILSEKEGVITSLESAKAEVEAKVGLKEDEIKNLQAELESVRGALANLEANAKTAEDKAIDIVAAQGIPALKIDVAASDVPMTRKEALEAYEAIKDPIERGKFYAKNREVLIG